MWELPLPALRRLIVATGLSLVLAACGGGGSATDSTSGSGSSSGSSSGSGSSAGTASSGSTSGSSAAVPGAPSINSASPGNGNVSIAFLAPASNGGAAISSYTASCTADGNTTVSALGSGSPILVTGLSGGITRACTVAASNSAGTGAASAAVSVTPDSAAPVDLTHLPVGDSKTTTSTPQAGYLYECAVQSGGGGASTRGPWFNADGTTWNYTTKVAVSGSVHWTSSFSASVAGSVLNIAGNGLPSHVTGTFPIAHSDPAYVYDQNPNTISAQSLAWALPASPVYHSTPTCVGGEVGILATGARLFNAVDGMNRDAGAWEIQDHCQGHPEHTGAYHYHTLTSCVTTADTAGQHSPLVGYAADGFGIYGNQGEAGVALSNADLDKCHGHTHSILVNGVSVVQYHYHATPEFPYVVGCYRGTPATIH